MDATLYENKTNVLNLSSSSGAWPPFSEPLCCQALLPQSLPGFTHMVPLPKFLVGLPLMIALEEIGCYADIWALKLQLLPPGRYKNYSFSSNIFKGSRKTETQGGECQWVPWPLLCSYWPWGSQAQKGPNAPSLSRTVSSNRNKVCTRSSRCCRGQKLTTTWAQFCIMLLRTAWTKPRNKAKMGS